MKNPRTAKRLALLLLCLAGIAAAGAFGAWTFLQQRIRLNARAPYLVSHPRPAPDVAFRTLDGQPMHLAQFHGKAVFLDFWGTWCLQCVAEMPSVQALYNHFRNDPQVVFLIVSRLDSPQAVRRYARRNHFNLPFYLIDDAQIPPSMQLNQYPATFLYAPDGSLVAQHTAAADWSAPSVISFLDRLKQPSFSANR